MIMWHFVPDWSEGSVGTDKTEIRGARSVHARIVHHLKEGEIESERGNEI